MFKPLFYQSSIAIATNWNKSEHFEALVLGFDKDAHRLIFIKEEPYLQTSNIQTCRIFLNKSIDIKLFQEDSTICIGDWRILGKCNLLEALCHPEDLVRKFAVVWQMGDLKAFHTLCEEEAAAYWEYERARRQYEYEQQRIAEEEYYREMEAANGPLH